MAMWLRRAAFQHGLGVFQGSFSGLLLACGCLFFVAGAVESTSAASWTSDFEAAEAESKRTGKPLLVHFYADWCGPCREMESKTLHRPEVQGLLNDAVIGVKLNADHRSDLVRRFGVSSLPTDVLVTSGGQVVHRQSGFQSAGQYVASLAGRARSATRAVPRAKPAQPAVGGPMIADRSEGGPGAGTSMADSSRATTSVVPLPFAVQSSRPPMLRGYSPVALHESREWSKGLAEFSVTYRGQVYRMASAEEKARFEANPRRFTPRLLGCDAVTFASEDRALPGRLEYAAFYGEELYLFQTDENRRRFKSSPDRFTSSRVVKLEDIEGVLR